MTTSILLIVLVTCFVFHTISSFFTPSILKSKCRIVASAVVAVFFLSNPFFVPMTLSFILPDIFIGLFWLWLCFTDFVWYKRLITITEQQEAKTNV